MGALRRHQAMAVVAFVGFRSLARTELPKEKRREHATPELREPHAAYLYACACERARARAREQARASACLRMRSGEGACVRASGSMRVRARVWLAGAPIW